MSARHCLRAGFACLLVAWMTAPASAIWAPVALEVLVDQADVIVHGKVVAIKDAGFAVGNRAQDVAMVQVAKVLKILPHVGKQVEAVGVIQPAKGGIGLSTDLRYTVGQEGIWLLTYDAKRKAYRASHPSQYQPAKELATVTKTIAARAKIKGGKAVDGLVARAEISRTPFPKDPAFYELRLSLKNVSKKPIVVCTYVGNRPFVVQWTSPSGAKKSSHYDWLVRARLAGVREEDIHTLPPDGVIYIYAGSSAGIHFQAGGKPNPQAKINMLESGRHVFAVSYQNPGDKGLGKDAWTGTAVANAVTLDVE